MGMKEMKADQKRWRGRKNEKERESSGKISLVSLLASCATMAHSPALIACTLCHRKQVFVLTGSEGTPSLLPLCLFPCLKFFYVNRPIFFQTVFSECSRIPHTTRGIVCYSMVTNSFLCWAATVARQQQQQEQQTASPLVQPRSVCWETGARLRKYRAWGPGEGTWPGVCTRRPFASSRSI